MNKWFWFSLVFLNGAFVGLGFHTNDTFMVFINTIGCLISFDSYLNYDK